MRPEIGKHLHDVRQACLLLETFTTGKSFTEYQADALLRAGVERQFITIGEALFQAEKLEPTLNQAIPLLRQVIGFRNVLVHGYSVVQHATVWGVVQNDLPVLKNQVDALLTPAGPP